MKFSYLVTLTVALSISTAAFAANKEKTLFKEGNCNNCHDLSFIAVGPTLEEIADKYRGDPNAQAILEKKVRAGGSGSWGVMPMPGTRATFSDEKISILVKWILKQKAKPKEADKESGDKTGKKSK